MPILALIIAIIGGIAVWWWRAQQVKDAADAAIDAAGKARGMVNRARFKHRAGASVLAGVDTPGMAAATSVFMALSPGDHVVASKVMYWSLRNWLATFATHWGLKVDFVAADRTDDVAAAPDGHIGFAEHRRPIGAFVALQLELE